MRLPLAHWLGTALSFIGVTLIVRGGAISGASSPMGDLMMIACVLCWTVYTVAARPLLARYSPIVITGRDSPAVRRRVADLSLPHAVYGVKDKLAAAEPLLRQFGATWGEVAAMGDDWPDLPLLARAALACAPANAHAQAKAVAHHITAMAGGHGAAREFCDLLLVATGHYARLLAGQMRTLDAAAGATGAR